jgi:hypothetical protein
MKQEPVTIWRWLGGPLPRSVAFALALVAGPIGCALDTRPHPTGLSLTVTAPIPIPPGRAHATFQDGQVVSASNKLEPYCELEVRNVSGTEPQWITAGELAVTGISHRVLLDPTTQVPALSILSSCSEPLFQELIWQLRSAEASDVLFLRCIAPYYNCAFGPPLPPNQVQRQVGRYLAVRTAGPARGN